MLSIEKTPGDELYSSPFATGGNGNNIHVKVDIATLTSREVDAKGYLKPGVPLKQDTGTLPTAAGDLVVMVAEQTKIASGNTGLAAITAKPLIACRPEGTVNHDMLVSVLGAELTTGEKAAINGAGSNLRLTTRSI